jgi:hypothetical protein
MHSMGHTLFQVAKNSQLFGDHSPGEIINQVRLFKVRPILRSQGKRHSTESVCPGKLPFLDCGIGYVRFGHADDWSGKSLLMNTRQGKLAPCEIVALPFYDTEKRIPRGLEPTDTWLDD